MLRLSLRKMVAAGAIICGVVAVGAVALTAVTGPFPVLIVTQDMRGMAGFDGSVYPVLWWAMGAFLAAPALAYLLLVGPDLKAGMAWLAIVLLAGEILSFLGGIRLSPLAQLPLRESAPRWNIATGLMFHYWALGAFLGWWRRPSWLRDCGRGESGVSLSMRVRHRVGRLTNARWSMCS